MLKITVANKHKRMPMEVPEGKTVGEVKREIQQLMGMLGGGKMETRLMILSYGGSNLEDHWVMTDLSIPMNATVRIGARETVKPILHIFAAHMKDSFPVFDHQIEVPGALIGGVRAWISRKIGLPVSVFKLIAPSGKEMFDIHELCYYHINIGDVIRVEAWPGWKDFLYYATIGKPTPVVNRLSAHETTARFQKGVALYIAAHYGHISLASAMLKRGARPDERVGEHPGRQWCDRASHILCRRAPVHEAVEQGQLNVLRVFVSQFVTAMYSIDGMGNNPLNLAKECGAKHIETFLMSKQGQRIPCGHKTISLRIYAKTLAWAERGRSRALIIHGSGKSTQKWRRPANKVLVGVQPQVEVNGVETPRFPKERIVNRDDFLTLNPSGRTGIPPSRGKTICFAEPSDTDSRKEDKERLPGIPGARLTQSAYAVRKKTGKSPTPSKQDVDREGSKSAGPQKNATNARAANAALESWQRKKEEIIVSEEQFSRPARRRGREWAIKTKVIYKRRNYAYSGKEGIALPVVSVDSLPRPFYYVGKKSDEIGATLEDIQKHTHTSCRASAIQLLAKAQTFREKPWLAQVRMAISMTDKEIKRALNGCAA